MSDTGSVQELDLDLKIAALSDQDIVISDTELINFDWLKQLNNGVRPKIFIAIEWRHGQPSQGCLRTISLSDLQDILTRIQENNEVRKKAKK